MNKHDKPAESLYETKDTDYTELLDAAGAAFRHTVRKIISFLQLKPGMSILDIGTGNGYDLVDLAESVSPEGKIIGTEISEPHYAKSLQTIEASPWKDQIDVQLCDVNDLECPAESFDLVWCKYTLACFPDPLSSLKLIWKLVKRGGRVAVINDLVPMHWLPATLLGEDRARESRLYTAIFQYIADYRSKRRKELQCCCSISNTSCAGLMRQAGFENLVSYTAVAEEVGELSEPLKKTLQLFLQRSFSEHMKDYLLPADWEFVQALRNRDSPHYLFNRHDLHIIKPITALIGYRS